MFKYIINNKHNHINWVGMMIVSLKVLLVEAEGR